MGFIGGCLVGGDVVEVVFSEDCIRRRRYYGLEGGVLGGKFRSFWLRFKRGKVEDRKRFFCFLFEGSSMGSGVRVWILG